MTSNLRDVVRLFAANVFPSNLGSVTTDCWGVPAIFVSAQVSPMCPQFFGLRPSVSAQECPLLFGSVTPGVSAKSALEGVLGGVTGKKKKSNTILLSVKKRSNIKGHNQEHVGGHVSVSHVSWIQAFPLLVRMRFLFMFSSRVPFTDVPLQPNSPHDSVCRAKHKH